MTDVSDLRVLVIEDEAIVALMIEDMIQDLGCEVVASVSRLPEAREVAATAAIDLALLDVNVAGELVFPVAEILLERRIPFVFSTGYGQACLPVEFAGHPLVGKPFSLGQLELAIRQALATQ